MLIIAVERAVAPDNYVFVSRPFGVRAFTLFLVVVGTTSCVRRWLMRPCQLSLRSMAGADLLRK